MKTAMLNVKIDPKLKHEAQTIADELGLPLSAIVNASIKTLVRKRGVSFSLLSPSPLLQDAIVRSRTDRKRRKPETFTDAERMLESLTS